MCSLWQDLFVGTKSFDSVTLTFNLHLENNFWPNFEKLKYLIKIIPLQVYKSWGGGGGG